MNAYDMKMAIMDIIIKKHNDLEKEHIALKPNILGGPRSRHNEIMAESRMLVSIFREIRNIGEGRD